MGNVGRIVCVALPFILTVASLIALLVAGLSGVTDKNMYLFKVNTTDLSVSSSSITSLLNGRSLDGRDLSDSIIAATSGTSTSGASDLIASASSAAEAAAATATSASDIASSISGAVSGTNVTGEDLGLSDAYYVSLWNYCQTISSGGKECKKPQFNWAANATQSFENMLQSVASSTGENITLPDSIKTAMNTFSTVTKWTEVVFIIAYIALGVELVLGFFANCSRGFSCCTSIVAMFAAVAVGAAAGLTTAIASVVVGVVEGTAKAYGVTGSINTNFLAAAWVAAAFAIAAGFFWVFTICCCAPDHNRSRAKTGGFGRKKHLDDDSDTLPMTGAYAPLGENHNTAYGGHGANYGDGFGQGATYGNPRTGRNDMAYEPYQHRV